MNLRTFVYHLFSYLDSYNQLQLVIYLHVIQLWTELNESYHFPSKSNHNQQLGQLVSVISKIHSKLKLVVCVNLHFKKDLLPDLLLLIILIEEVRDYKSDTLLSLDTTDELMLACLVL